MRAVKAKRLRRIIYGDRPPRARKYYRHKFLPVVIADKFRRAYQCAKLKKTTPALLRELLRMVQNPKLA